MWHCQRQLGLFPFQPKMRDYFLKKKPGVFASD
jgi:hypothetical protein